MESKKRLFFGLEVKAPWPPLLPPGRFLDESCRHMTLAFLGETDFSKIKEILPSIPKLTREIGFVGFFDSVLFLPKRHPHVVAWQVQLLEDNLALECDQKSLSHWLKTHDFHVDEKNGFLPHVTICRSPFSISPWKKSFNRLPLITGDLHLYESLGNLRYQSCWSLQVKKPFEEIEHTADIAFRIRGHNIQQLHRHALIALSFKFPSLLDYFSTPLIADLDDIIIDLNDVIARADMEVGCPFKAISFHGEIKEESGVLEWDMIVDV